MIWLSMLTAAIAPGIALLSYFYLKDRYETEPLHLVAKMFLCGMLVVFPVIVIQRGLIINFGESHQLLFAYIFSALVEEFVKWFLFYTLIFKHPSFDEPYDGIVYAVAISLGFATLENIIYALMNNSSFSELLLRALLPVSGHALFGVLMGYYFGRAKFMSANADSSRSGKIRGSVKFYIVYALLLPVFWHGSFDYIQLAFSHYWGWGIIPLMAILWIRGLRKVWRANSKSPLRTLYREDQVNL